MEKLKKGQVTILVGEDRTTIELIDNTSGVVIAKANLSPEQLSAALSRRVRVPCEVFVDHDDLKNVGKKMEVDHITFQLERESLYGQDRIDAAIEATDRNCPKGWTPDYYFGSQDSFFYTNKKLHARCTIRRWIDEGEQA